MRATWNLPDQTTLLASGRTMTQVLVEYDGPQIAIFSDSSGEFLGLVADQDDRAQRWLQARLSSTEKQALLLGAETLYRALMKDELWVVDIDLVNGGECAWVVNSESLDEQNLPRPKALLPRLVREHFCGEESLASPELKLDGAGVVVLRYNG
ncbi:MAG: hypothetical protein H0U74_10255 [Bradymonadaceae bacterium]|nr:hypothetical protein [Lujinxingiaceae bacterium]